MTACSAAVLLVDDDIIVRHPLTEYCANAASLFLRRRTEMMAGMFGVDTASQELSQTCWFIEIEKALESVLSG
jgi:hypothetical protein